MHTLQAKNRKCLGAAMSISADKEISREALPCVCAGCLEQHCVRMFPKLEVQDTAVGCVGPRRAVLCPGA
jgi:hypothetical protein